MVRHALVLAVRLCSARPVPVPVPCSPRDYPGAGAAYSLLALPARAGEDEGKKTASIFGTILSPRACSWIRTASTQGDGSVQRESCRRVRLGARALAVVSRRGGFALSL